MVGCDGGERVQLLMTFVSHSREVADRSTSAGQSRHLKQHLSVNFHALASTPIQMLLRNLRFVKRAFTVKLQ